MEWSGMSRCSGLYIGPHGWRYEPKGSIFSSTIPNSGYRGSTEHRINRVGRPAGRAVFSRSWLCRGCYFTAGDEEIVNVNARSNFSFRWSAQGAAAEAGRYTFKEVVWTFVQPLLL